MALEWLALICFELLILGIGLMLWEACWAWWFDSLKLFPDPLLNTLMILSWNYFVTTEMRRQHRRRLMSRISWKNCYISVISISWIAAILNLVFLNLLIDVLVLFLLLGRQFLNNFLLFRIAVSYISSCVWWHWRKGAWMLTSQIQAVCVMAFNWIWITLLRI